MLRLGCPVEWLADGDIILVVVPVDGEFTSLSECDALLLLALGSKYSSSIWRLRLTEAMIFINYVPGTAGMLEYSVYIACIDIGSNRSLGCTYIGYNKYFL